MRSIKATVTSALVIGLLASSSFGVLGRDEEDANGIASAFRATAGPRQAVLLDPQTGVELVTDAWDATDSRASGLMSTVVARGGVCAEDSRVIDGVVDCELPSYSVSISGVRLVNDGGAWIGTLTALETEQRDERTRRQRRRGRGTAPINSRGGYFELTGEGAYEGLSLLATTDRRGVVGLIIPSDVLPTGPDPLTASAIADATLRAPGEPRASFGLGAFGISDGPEFSEESVEVEFELTWMDRSDDEDGFRIYRVPVRQVCVGNSARYRSDGAPVLVDTIPPDTTSAEGTYMAIKRDDFDGETTGNLNWRMGLTAFNGTGESMIAIVPDADVQAVETSC